MPKGLVVKSNSFLSKLDKACACRTLIKEFALDQHSASVELRDFTAQHFPLYRKWGGGRTRKRKRKQCMLTTLRKIKQQSPEEFPSLSPNFSAGSWACRFLYRRMAESQGTLRGL